MIENAEYGQPQKRLARKLLLTHAVDSLTNRRRSSPLVTKEGFAGLIDYCAAYFLEHGGTDLTVPLEIVRRNWESVQSSRVGARTPGDLKVLFLCGPEPLNDLEELTSLGVASENIWAVEGDRKAYEAAARQLLKADRRIRLHQGSLSEFLQIVPEQFDIVYFDACGPLFGGKPKTSTVLRELFVNQRMAPLSVLITNFAATPRDNTEEWVNRLYAWYAPRYFQPVYDNIDGAMAVDRIYDPREFRSHLHENLECYYSDFVSRFTIEFVSELLPWWRVRALPSAKRAYFAPEQQLRSAVEDAFAISDSSDIEEIITSTGHSQLAPDAYPLFWMAALAKKHLESNDALLELIIRDTLLQAKLADAISAISLIRNYYEATGAMAQHNLDACSDELRSVLEAFRWFDSPGMPWHRMFCDTPLPNLAVDLLVGVYGYPYHVNSNELRRIEYRAKQTTMYSDVFVLDQCRYMYDLVPTLSMFGDGLPIDRQFQIRVCMSLMRRHFHESCRELFKGSTLGNIDGFSLLDWPDREVIA